MITDKTQPHTHQPEVIQRLAQEIHTARQENPGLKMVIGHGSGSFGHTPARQYGTRQGVHTAQEWKGFFQVWQAARELNLLVWQNLCEAGLPVVTISPSSSITAKAGKVETWNLFPLQAALEAGLVPLIYGDVVFDSHIGGTILSTEDLFFHLAQHLNPKRILLAGIEQGVWAGFPSRTGIIANITPATLEQVRPALQGSAATDVTGGMVQKVESMLALAQQVHGLEILIFSGEQKGVLERAISGSSPGTVIRAV